MTWSLGELAVRFGCTLKGDPDVRVSHVAAIEAADAASITFLANPRFRRFLKQTRAGAVVLEAKFADDSPVNALLTSNPYATYARIASVLHPPATHPPGVHPSASVEASATID